jgi:hypothetical protein
MHRFAGSITALTFTGYNFGQPSLGYSGITVAFEQQIILPPTIA